MFEQIVGNGANAFLIIIMLVVGFVAGLSFIDSRATEKDNEHNRPF